MRHALRWLMIASLALPAGAQEQPSAPPADPPAAEQPATPADTDRPAAPAEADQPAAANAPSDANTSADVDKPPDGVKPRIDGGTATTLIEIVAILLSKKPSLALNVNESAPA